MNIYIYVIELASKIFDGLTCWCEVRRGEVLKGTIVAGIPNYQNTRRVCSISYHRTRTKSAVSFTKHKHFSHTPNRHWKSKVFCWKMQQQDERKQEWSEDRLSRTICPKTSLCWVCLVDRLLAKQAVVWKSPAWCNTRPTDSWRSTADKRRL